jgi:Rad3-related DNA helicase
MVNFCAKCGAYISPKQEACSRCNQIETSAFEAVNLPIKDLTVDHVLTHFPSHTFRKYQREVISSALQAYQTGKKCVIVIAPTGAGKSYVNAAFTSVTQSFYVTPQLALIDQLLADPNLKGRFVEIKGRQNYSCYYSPRRGVHLGKCVTEGYPCHERLDVCPYWMQKHLALQAPSVLMSLAYLVFEGTTEGSESYLGTRDLLVLDEAHNLEEQCLNHVSLKFTPFSIPYEIYQKLLPNLKNVSSRVELEVFLAEAAGYLKLMLGRLETKSEQQSISLVEAENKTRMERFLENYNLFTFSKAEWVWEVQNDQLVLQPVFAREFMKSLVWKRGEHYLISSATILDPEEYVRLNGLTDVLKEDEVEILEVPSTFPAENRPIIDATVGPLTRQEWDSNMSAAVTAIEEILHKEKGNVAIHAHSYRHQRALVASLSPQLKQRLIVHTADDREEKLQEWMRSRGKVFVSVAFNEGQDWKYDICSAQILLKVPFANIGDRRVKRRLELGHRQWYLNQAMLEIIQAYGRAVRAEDDAARFYVVDGSFTELLKNTWQFVPEWFKAALPPNLQAGTSEGGTGAAKL